MCSNLFVEKYFSSNSYWLVVIVMVKVYSRFAIAMFDHLFRVGKLGCSKLIDWYSGDWGWFLVVVFWFEGEQLYKSMVELEVVGCGGLL